MGSYQSTNEPKPRESKWVRFSGSKEELARIALDHAKYQAAKRRPLLNQISQSTSRRNGFSYQEECDSVSEHWCWSPSDETLQLQAVNCSMCGNYVCVSRRDFPLNPRIQCRCVPDDGLGEFSEYEYGYDPVVPQNEYDAPFF